jgi:hypothetical protein
MRRTGSEPLRWISWSFAPADQPGADGKSRPSGLDSAGRGAYAIRALPDLCLGIESGRPVSSHPFEPSAATALVGWSPALLRMLFFKGR